MQTASSYSANPMIDLGVVSAETSLHDQTAQMDITWLLSPFNQSGFVGQYWAKKPLRIARGDRAYYSRLFPETELELALYAASQTAGAVELLSEDDAPQPCRFHQQALEGFRQGKSLRIDSVQRFSHNIMVLARNLEEVIHCSINVNMYLTPGAGKKALDRHYDTHDVFVLQVHGNKTWRLFDPPFPAPLEYLPLQRSEHMKAMQKHRLDHDLSARDSCILTDEFTLNAGDGLYLPRGFWHEAESEPGKVSCHLTVGIQPTTYLDVLSVALSQVALSDLRLREQLPFGFARDPTAGKTVAARIADVAEGLSARLDTEAALAKVAAHSLRTHKTGFHNDLLCDFQKVELSGLTAESRLFVRQAMRCRVDEDTSPIRMSFGRQTFEIRPAYEDACRFISNMQSFITSELPGNLALPEKLALVQQLITEGLLATSPDGVVVSRSEATKLTFEAGKWFPIHLDRKAGTIEWLDFGAQPLTHPFFQQSVRHVKTDTSNTQRGSTSIRVLDELEDGISPSGFVFHISRCGSTLLSNGLRVIRNAIVISEAQPIGEAVASLAESRFFSNENDEHQVENRERLLRGVVRAYGQRRSLNDSKLVIKFSSWNILHIAAIQRIWPEVPCVILVRDPVEVAVSCLEAPPGWMRWRTQPRVAHTMLPWASETLESISPARFCARMIGDFLKSASSAVSAGCHVIDYRDLNKARIVDVARLFGLESHTEDFERIEQSFSVYSKESSGTRVFIGDQDVKQAKATKELRSEIQRWAQQPYNTIVQNSVVAG